MPLSLITAGLIAFSVTVVAIMTAFGLDPSGVLDVLRIWLRVG